MEDFGRKNKVRMAVVLVFSARYTVFSHCFIMKRIPIRVRFSQHYKTYSDVSGWCSVLDTHVHPYRLDWSIAQAGRTCSFVESSSWRTLEKKHSKTPAGEDQNLFATLTVRTYVWIVPNWTLQPSMDNSMERRVRAVSYVGETESLLSVCSP